jgi:hypothetical protein
LRSSSSAPGAYESRDNPSTRTACRPPRCAGAPSSLLNDGSKKQPGYPHRFSLSKEVTPSSHHPPLTPNPPHTSNAGHLHGVGAGGLPTQ